jgi:hypothetical protein
VPTPLTLADLSMLVVGFAVVFSLPQLHYPSDRVTIDNISMPGWIAWLIVIQEVALKGGLVLAPVIVARCARYGELPRPADWSAILLGLRSLDEVIQRGEWMKRFARWYLFDFRPALGYPVPSLPHERYPSRGLKFRGVIMYGYDGFPSDFTPGDESRLWGWCALILLMMISAALWLGWNWMSGWAKTALLSLASLTWVSGVTYLLFAGLGRASLAISGWTGLTSSVVVPIGSGLGSLPAGVLLGVPVVAVLHDLGMGGGKSWAWTERVGMMIALIALPIGSVIYWYADLINRSDPSAQARLGVNFIQLIAVILISWAVVKGLRGARLDPVSLRPDTK